ncbi:MAG: glucose 1-dehydrogenase [Ferruginibacter sp.]|nr:glucose 1-dehydrogenase [Ferruginibacter sp.]
MNKQIIKTAFITGGAKGIGLATAKAFISEGIRVCIVDIDENEGEKIQAAFGNKLLFIYADVSKTDEVQWAVNKCIEHFGRIDYLINNAGIQRYSNALNCTEEEWDLVMNVNLKSYFLCTKYCLPHIQASGGGCIVNVASVQSFVATANAVHYVTAKTALLGFTRSVAVDFAPAVRCIAVCPGTVYTPMVLDSWALASDPLLIEQESINMHLVKRVAQPSEIADLVVYLCSPKAGFITGQSFRIDGGIGVGIPGSVKDDQKKKINGIALK